MITCVASELHGPFGVILLSGRLGVLRGSVSHLSVDFSERAGHQTVP